MNLYSEKTKKIIRIISIVTIIILLTSNIKTLVLNEFDINSIIKFCQNSFVIVLTVFLLIYPAKLSLIAIMAFQYSFVFQYQSSTSIMSILMFMLGCSVLLMRGFFNQKKAIKFVIVMVPFILLYLSELRFGVTDFLNSSIYQFGYIFVVLLIIFFLDIYKTNLLSNNEKVLNLSNFEGLKKRDADWLQRIQSKEKYDCIAIDYKMSIGSVKNRLKIIFDTLEVGDKTGFLNKYSDYKIIFEQPEEAINAFTQNS